ncbi:MAG: Periplasmic zinc-binding protein TroA [Chlamydiia bacterium]|nr:Periplasmic zinc-binding protein TroA [Chlamydiia bacterium]
MNKNLFYISIFLVSALIFSCFFPGNNKIENEKKTILSTTVMIDSVLKQIVEDKFSLSVLIEGEIDPHSYQMKKGDVEKLERAELVFANGLSLEHNPSLLYHLKSKKAIFLGDELLKSSPDCIICANSEVDPHIWMDLELMQQVVDRICEKVVQLDEQNTEFYLRNASVLKEEMKSLDLKIKSIMEKVPEHKRYLVSSHDAFNYFVRRYFHQQNEERLFSMQGLSPEAEISLKRMSQVIDFIKEHKVEAIFYEPNLPKDAIWKVIEICKKFDVDVKISPDPLYGDTLGGMSYLEMMEHNATVISKNLRGTEIE